MEDQLNAMLHLERTYRVESVACRKGREHGEQPQPNEDWRRKICEWSYRVVDHFRIDRDVVSVAMNFFDRYLSLQSMTGDAAASAAAMEPDVSRACPCPSCRRAVDSQTFQLAAMTSLYLAIKLHAESCGSEYYQNHAEGGADAMDISGLTVVRPRRKKLRLHSFVDLSRGQFTAEDICSMERKMLATLQWKVHPTTPSTTVAYLLRLMPAPSTVPMRCRGHYDLVLHVLNELARYLSELSICMASLTSDYLPSAVSYAAILVAMQMLTPTALPLQVREAFCATISRITDLHPHHQRTIYLMDRLRRCFWPEMLLDECEAERDHPISMARSAGLLDIGMMYKVKLGRTGSNDSFTDVAQQAMDDAPVYVSP